MPQEFVKPDLESISTLLQMFLGDGVSVADGDPSDLSDRFVATYVNDSNDLVALCACDLPFVAYTGAALSMVPAGVANDAIASQSITDVMADNFHEVMNICSTLMMSDSSSHLRLDKTLVPESSADPISKLQEGAEQSTAFSVDIPGYGNGSVAFLIA